MRRTGPLLTVANHPGGRQSPGTATVMVKLVHTIHPVRGMRRPREDAVSIRVSKKKRETAHAAPAW